MIGIYKWKRTKANEIWYRVRGDGEDYQQFYQWLHTKRVKDSWDDWPWDHFTLKYRKDEKELEKKFKQHILETEEDDIDDSWNYPSHEEPDEASIELAKILKEEIDREIMQRIIEDINKTRND